MGEYLEKVRNEIVALVQLATENHAHVPDGAFGAALGILEEIGDRHEFQMAVFGKRSATTFTEPERVALTMWVSPVKDAYTHRWRTGAAEVPFLVRRVLAEWKQEVKAVAEEMGEVASPLVKAEQVEGEWWDVPGAPCAAQVVSRWGDGNVRAVVANFDRGVVFVVETTIAALRAGDVAEWKFVPRGGDGWDIVVTEWAEAVRVANRLGLKIREYIDCGGGK